MERMLPGLNGLRIGFKLLFKPAALGLEKAAEFEGGIAEIDQEACFDIKYLEIIDRLREMDILEGLGRFELYQHCGFHQEIHPSDPDYTILKIDLHFLLPFKMQASHIHFQKEGSLIYLLLETATNESVHFHGCTDDLPGNLIYFLLHAILIVDTLINTL